MSRAARSDAPRGAGNPGLTPTELAVAQLVGRSTNRELADRLGLSEKTIEAHLSRIYRKLGVRSRTELALLVARSGT